MKNLLLEALCKISLLLRVFPPGYSILKKHAGYNHILLYKGYRDGGLAGPDKKLLRKKAWEKYKRERQKNH